MGPPDTQKTGDAVGKGGALSPTAHKLLLIQMQMEGRCPQESQFPSWVRKHDVTELPKRCFNVQCMSSAVQVTEREGGREGKKGHKREETETCFCNALGPIPCHCWSMPRTIDTRKTPELKSKNE